jgi:23S rRNA (adenine2030-N6)-methyltransferase
VRAALRPGDRFIACELHPEEALALKREFAGDRAVEVRQADGYKALKALLPPVERRGLLLIDPPFEQKDEFERMAAGFAAAFAKWPTGSYLLWYPVKSRRITDGLARHVAAVAETGKPAGKCLRLEFSVAPQQAGGPLTSTGLLIVNPPWTLAGELKTVLPELEKPLGQGGAARFRLEIPKP